MKAEKLDGKSTNKGKGSAIKEAFKAKKNKEFSEIQQKGKSIGQQKNILREQGIRRVDLEQ